MLRGKSGQLNPSKSLRAPPGNNILTHHPPPPAPPIDGVGFGAARRLFYFWPAGLETGPVPRRLPTYRSRKWCRHGRWTRYLWASFGGPAAAIMKGTASITRIVVKRTTPKTRSRPHCRKTDDSWSVKRTTPCFRSRPFCYIRKTDDSQSGTRPWSWPGIRLSNPVFYRRFYVVFGFGARKTVPWGRGNLSAAT